MIVMFTSLSEKNALYVTRRILDAYAERVGKDTWKTNITSEGLETIRHILRSEATKSTSVACYHMKSRSIMEMLWIVGNRKNFGENGAVSVGTTKKEIMHNEWEHGVKSLPQIKALVAMAALLHDWGKANDFFQKKLRTKVKTANPWRHELVSCLLIRALVTTSGNAKNDDGWLSILADGSINEEKILSEMAKLKISRNFDNIIKDMPPIAQLVCWLIISHHRMPQIMDKNLRMGYAIKEEKSFKNMISSIGAKWGYENKSDEMQDKDLDACISFSNGLLSESNIWLKQLKKWACRLSEEKENILKIVSKNDEQYIRPVLTFARLGLMLGDYNASSLSADETLQGQKALAANTYKETGDMKQMLDEHLVSVMKHALSIVVRLPHFFEQMDRAYDIKSLQHRSPQKYSWQDKAVQAISSFRAEHGIDDTRRTGWFIVNMASTGTGKTIANAKIMRAISPDGISLRYTLALGLRTLTLQTGDEYRTKVGITSDDMAVVIGSEAVRKLHEEARAENDDDMGDELLGYDLRFSELPESDKFLDVIFPKRQNIDGRKAERKAEKAFLYKPVLVTTIDHLIGATETKRGGRYMMPMLRMMSSDLVIDEVDDFGIEDLWAVARLVHLAGMFGRSVVLSSATMPPGLVQGLFESYMAGRKCSEQFWDNDNTNEVSCVWCDEFKAEVEPVTKLDEYLSLHEKFAIKRVKKLKGLPAKRKGIIEEISCGNIEEAQEELKDKYFSAVLKAAVGMHERQRAVDGRSSRKVSFGLIRMANITPCVELSRYLLKAELPAGYDMRLMTYHGRQVMLMRSEQEKYLDKIMKHRANGKCMEDADIRKVLDKAGDDTTDVMFVVVSTPVEEIGRDHDFDWAVVEPSSCRSIIQLAGRVRRHRDYDGAEPNIAVMQYNIKGAKGKSPAFIRPGFETNGDIGDDGVFRLPSNDIKKLLDIEEISRNISAIPRIYNNEKNGALADLEHEVMGYFSSLEEKGPYRLSGWLNEYWWLTAMMQDLQPFRSGSPEIELYRIYDARVMQFYKRSDDKKKPFAQVGEMKEIEEDTFMDENSDARKRLWRPISYEEIIRERAEAKADENEDIDEVMKRETIRYGMITKYDDDGEYAYSDYFGLWKKERDEA